MAAWPELKTPGWEETSRTMHLWTQVVGKTRLALAPMTNHWWHVPLYVSARGLTTSAVAQDSRAFEVEFDFIAHRLEARCTDGTIDSFSLESGTVASFHRRYVAMLGKLGVKVELNPLAVEIPETIYLDRDDTFRTYSPDWAHRFFLALLQADRLLKEFRAGFVGKASPVHFFWGSFDIAVSRFSGRPAPLHPGGVPHLSDRVTREAYSHEVSSAGFWPGGSGFPEAVFYSYAYPEPPHFAEARPLPEPARYDPGLREFVLPYEAVRRAPNPDQEVLTFLETTYAAAAELGRWDRRALERRAPRAGADARPAPGIR